MLVEHYLRELAQEGPVKHSLLMQISGLTEEEMEQFCQWWPSLSVERRRTVMERMVTLAEDSVELDFNIIFRYCLADGDPKVRAQAVSGLWECDDHTVVGPLIALLKEDPSEEVRTSAAMALGKFGSLAEAGKLLRREGERIKAALLSLLEDERGSVEIRSRALEAVACFNTTRIRELIRWAYTSSNPKLRTSALYAMGRTGDPTWLPSLIKELGSSDSAMRYESASACAELGEEEVVPYLIPLIQDDESDVQMAAIQALGAIGGLLSKKALKLCLKNGDETVKEAAREALEHLEVEEDPLNFKF